MFLRISSLNGNQYIQEILHGQSQVCYEMLRMHKITFLHFCDLLKREGGLENTNNLIVEEQVAMFLIIIGKTWDQRAICDCFQHYLETVNRNFRHFMSVVASLAKHIVHQSVDGDVSPHIKNNRKCYPWFKDCVGEIEETCVSAWVPAEKTVSFRGRRYTLTQNVMCVCNFNMEFTFVYSIGTLWRFTNKISICIKPKTYIV
ncbi:hypothetical protein CFOL_v3_04275 [Cephalotus follicularis]|uniref:DUF8040 domain-containing protein n=1 Tax=Cephalotus follicularis TaxID=3775 RepID=A0A1Q3AYB5_CEPFO|nr:hypothetical protein CFOL_v3_04275 [Cephalotus follicularis]